MILNKENTICISLQQPNSDTLKMHQYSECVLNRRDNFSNQAKYFGLDFCFFDAIDGASIEKYDKDSNKHNQTMCRTKCGIKFNYKPTQLIFNNCSNPTLSNYYIACALSHLCLYEKLLFDSVNDFYLIFEDDYIFSKNFTINDLRFDLSNLPKDVDLCFFSPRHAGVDSYTKEKQINESIYKIKNTNGIEGTSMYLISKKGAEKLLNVDGLNVNYNADELIGRHLNDLICYNTDKIYGFGHLERHKFDTNIIKKFNLNYH